MAKITFSAQTARKRPIKPLSDKYKESQLRPNIEVGPGERPHMPLIPLRFLDAKYQDVTTEQYVVIPKGRIISAITVQNETTGDVLNISKQDTDGDIPAATVDQTDGVTPLYIGADESYYGYSRDIAGLIVPANGGVDRTITYDAADVAAMVPKADGNIVSAGDTYVLPANAPIGVAQYDVFQDIRGSYLNYELYKSYGILAEQHIKVPYVDFGLLRSLSTGVKFVNEDYTNATTPLTGYKVASATIDPVEDAGYVAVENKYSFMYFDSGQNGEAALAGQLLTSDLFGNWVPAGSGATDDSTISLNPARTGQTMGRLLFCDTRYPKDMLESVETYYGYRVAGTGTEGLSENLFDFIYTVLVSGGYTFAAADAAKVAIDLVQKGAFGYAHIQLMAR